MMCDYLSIYLEPLESHQNSSPLHDSDMSQMRQTLIVLLAEREETTKITILLTQVVVM